MIITIDGVSMRFAMILALAMMSAACSQGTAPPDSSATSSSNSSPSDSNRVVTTVTDVVDATLLRQSFLNRSVAQVARDMSIMLTSSKDAATLAYLQSVWSLDPAVMSELDAEFIRSAPVRAYMANVLAQLASNRVIKIDLVPVREALRNGLGVPDQDVNSDSLIGLGYVAEASDIDRFVRLADGSNIVLAKLAVSALANACGQYAAEQLDGFIQHAKNPEIRADAEAMRSALKDSTAARCAGK